MSFHSTRMTQTPQEVSSAIEAKTVIHLFSGFLGSGKTTMIKNLMTQKPADEKWGIIVNEFGEIGIDGAVLADNGMPVEEVSGGCLCCTAGAQMNEAFRKILLEKPQRILIEASGLAHAASVIDELRSFPERDTLIIGAAFTLVDPRQFINPNYAAQPVYRDQISVADVLVATKTDLCDEGCLKTFTTQAQSLFPPKSLIVAMNHGHADLSWLDASVITKSRYRIKALPQNTSTYRSQGYAFPAETEFDGEKLSNFFDDLPKICHQLVRAKGVFQILGTWVWLNWTDGQWGAGQIAWRRDSRFELVAENFDEEEIFTRLNTTIQKDTANQ